MSTASARPSNRHKQRLFQSFAFPTTGIKATGTIACATNAAAADGDTVKISDGFITKTYEYDKSANGVVAGNVNWAVGTTAASNATALAALITTNQPAFTVVDDLAGNLTLTHKWPGAGGNVTITKTGAIASAVTGMAGGTDPSGNILANTAIKLHKALRRSIRIERAALNLPAGLVQSDTDYVVITLKKGSTVMATWSTKTTGGNGTIAADTPVEMVVTTTLADQFLADTDQLSLVFTVTGAPTVPPGRLTVEGVEQ